ncbi:Predicted arabinose efflux permease, MFS family [Actinopolyspora alba]|uniref:Predicted arabinose efflux permease, MFS family n=1 Tax=Actinopolyspora alba TaxID=673379 RepID=A0A1I1ZD83_9ACTN|nr:MFS transporter [Actinopolyspora alba]SFE29288.1 Predicted arabinose efflux permease, MFS family [Actinopolyspora alba]
MLFRRFFDEDGSGPRLTTGGIATGRAHEVRTAVYLLVVLTAGAYLPSPLYPDYQQAFGFGDLTMTSVYATFALVSAPALLLFGPASDALGPRTVLRASVLADALGSCCFALASGPAWLLVGRAAQGTALGAVTGATSALLVERAANRDRLRASTVASMGFVAGTAVGPLVAGVLAQYAPAPRLSPYLVHLALLAVGWCLVSGLPAATSRVGRWRPTRPRIPAGIRASFTTAAASGFLAWTGAGLFLAVVPVVLGRRAGIENPAITGALLCAVLTCSVLIQPLVTRFGPRLAQLLGLGALLSGLVLLALTGGGSLSVTAIAAVATGIGHGLTYSGAGATIDAVAPERQRAGVTSALYIAFYAGAGLPAVAVGLLTRWHDMATAVSWLGAVAASLVPLVVGALLLADRNRRVSRTEFQARTIATYQSFREPRRFGRLARRDAPAHQDRLEPAGAELTRPGAGLGNAASEPNRVGSESSGAELESSGAGSELSRSG